MAENMEKIKDIVFKEYNLESLTELDNAPCIKECPKLVIGIRAPPPTLSTILS